MQSAQTTIDRFLAAAGEIGPIEWLTETGSTTTRIEDAVEALVTKRLAPAPGRDHGGVFTVRVALATLPDLNLGFGPSAPSGGGDSPPGEGVGVHGAGAA